MAHAVAALQTLPQALPRTLPLQVAAGVAWVVGYVVWAHVYYAVLDPVLRRAVGASVGAPIAWVWRKGTLSGGALSFRLRRSTWSWGIADDAQRGTVKDGAVYTAGVLAVQVLAGLWPIAVLCVAVLWMRLLSGWVALPLLFLIIPLYSRYWSGAYRPLGAERMTPRDAAP